MNFEFETIFRQPEKKQKYDVIKFYDVIFFEKIEKFKFGQKFEFSAFFDMLAQTNLGAKIQIFITLKAQRMPLNMNGDFKYRKLSI